MGYGQTGKTRGTSPSSVLWVDPAGLSRFAFYAARLAPQENIVIRRSPLVIFKLARGFRVVTAGRRGLVFVSLILMFLCYCWPTWMCIVL